MEKVQYINSDFIAPKDAWDALSLPEKATMMKVAVNHGIYDLSAIKQKYNEFAEGGKKEDEEYYSTMEKVAEENYKDWGFSSPEEALVHALNDNTYDYRGYYKSNPISTANATTHWPDTYKTAYHPTFSVESIYSGRPSQYNPQGLYGGHWVDDKFVPAPWQIENKHFIGGPLVEAAMNEYKKGGKIYIKPSHRGRLTELKKRTGKTEAELYRTGGPAVRKMITFARSARKWKHGDGGPLVNLFYPGGDTNSSNYRYVLDDESNWNRITNDEMGRVFQGLIITPAGGSGQPAPTRYRISYDAGVTKDDAAPIRNLFSKIQEVADTPIMVQQNSGTATGYNSFGQYMPKSQSTYGNQAELLFAELTAPTALSDAQKAYQTLRHPIQTVKTIRSIFSDGTPAMEWATANKQYSIGNGVQPSILEKTKAAAELGRNDVINWYSSPYYRNRWNVYNNFISEKDINRILAKQNRLISEPFNFNRTSEQLTLESIVPVNKGSKVYGATKNRPVEQYTIDGHTYQNFDTGTDVSIASDIGEEARKTAISELLHHSTGNSIGYPQSGNFEILEGDWLSPIGLRFKSDNATVMPRGDAWQNFVVMQNNGLLPKESAFSLAVKNSPDDAMKMLIREGESPENAEILMNRASYMVDIQEQMEHLKTAFIADIKPYLKNPNDAKEIERYIGMHPEIILDDPHLNILVNRLRPGTFKEYAKYFAEALASLPVITQYKKQ